jgi:hypothetical protein
LVLLPSEVDSVLPADPAVPSSTPNREVVPGLVEIEVAVPHLRLAEW